VPRCSSHQFTGRQLYAHMLKENFGLRQAQEARNEHKIVVIYGLGGSGKTQFCLRYAEDNRTQ
jgi:GTPase SAR1 family protein